MGIRRLATNEDDFLDKLTELFNRPILVGDRMHQTYIQIPGDPRMFTKNNIGWHVLIDDGCSLRKTKSYELDEILDAIHNDGVTVFACTRWKMGQRVVPVSILHDCHNRGWRGEYET